MGETTAPDLNINGVATAAGGRYREIRIDGVGTVSGSVRSEGFRLNGIASIRGSLETGRLNADGKIKVEGRLAAGTADVNGLVDVFGALTGDRLAIRGLLNVRGDCEAERFESEGGFDIEGLLNAGEVDVSLHGRAKTREIGCESIRVRVAPKKNWKKLFQWLLGKWAPELSAGTIEGDDIDLENTVAAVVRGNRVAIGPGCRIGRVEYRTELRKHPKGHVGEERKTGDGSGLA